MTRILSASLVVVGAATTPDLIESHTVSLPTVWAVGGIVLPAVWWLSRRFAKSDANFRTVFEKLQALDDKVEALPCPGKPAAQCKPQHKHHESQT